VGSDLLLAWRSAPLGVFVVGCLHTTLLYRPTCSVRSGVAAMITEAFYSENLTPALAYVNNLPERISHWPERWRFTKRTEALPHITLTREYGQPHFQPSLTRIQDPTGPQVATALPSPQPKNKESRFREWLHQVQTKKQTAARGGVPMR
jgi:hypothetical protein